MIREGESDVEVSVVVPTLDRPERSAAVVRAVLEGSESPLEVIVVDQGKGAETERALAALADGRVLHLRRGPPSTSAARNAGAERARGAYVAFLDDDVAVPPTWLADVGGELRRLGFPDALFGEVRGPAGFVPDRTTVPVSLFRPEGPRIWDGPVHPNRVGYAANFACRRDVFLALGGFDPRLGPGSRFPGAEDMDFVYRLLRAGYRVGSTPRFSIVHEQWREPEDLPRLYRGYNVGGAAFCAKHLRTGDLRAGLFLLEQVGGDAKMLASALRRRSGLRARVALARTAGTWSGLAGGLRSLGGGSPPDPGRPRRSRPAGGS
ncbi:MAG TPA: glycosyltransferase family 2 protein [Gaiellaceae bacterium]|nr:glycosyltransferase family 2 protein [Gaiellaceae bacterium]